MIPLGILNFRTIASTSSNPVTSGLILELYSDSGLGLSGSSVTGWDDQSGSGNSLTWNTGFPTYTDSYFGTERSVNIGNNQGLKIGSLVGMSGSQAFSVFAVSNHTQPSTGVQFIFNSIGVPSNNFQIYLQRPSGTTQLSGLVMGNVGTLTRTINTLDNSSRIYAFVADKSTNPDTATFYINGSSASSVVGASHNNTDTFINTSFSLAGSTGMTIRFGSILMYNRRLSEAEIASVNSYLTAKYSI